MTSTDLVSIKPEASRSGIGSPQFGLRPGGGRGDKRGMRFLCLLAWWSLAPAAVWAAEPPRFSARLTPEQFQAAGLDKLTPEQLAALDRFVAGDNEVATAAAVKEAASTSAVAKEAASGVAAKAMAPATPPKPRSLLVRLLPGTRIEYETVETRIVGEFRGWDFHGELAVIEHAHHAVVLHHADFRVWQVPLFKDVHHGLLVALLHDDEHALLRLAQQRLVRRHA